MVIKMRDMPQVEGLFCTMYHNNILYVVASICRPQTLYIGVIDELKKYLCTHVKSEARIILSGDLNLPDIDWTSVSATKHSDIVGEAALDIAFTFYLLQVVMISQGCREVRNQHLISFLVSVLMLQPAVR